MDTLNQLRINHRKAFDPVEIVVLERNAALARVVSLENALRRINEYWPAGVCPSELWTMINKALTDGAKYETQI